MSGPVPGVFRDVVGQDTLVAALAAASGPDGVGMTHAWLFTGPPGSGRSVAARAFAAALQCPRHGCGECHVCSQVLAGTHPDATVVTPAGLSIPVAEARSLVRRAALSPITGGWQVVLVEDADRLTEQAANALLKAVEEPPRHGVFLLCAPSVEDLLPTVRSRCRLMTLRVPSAAAVAEVLQRRDDVDEATAYWAARAAQGHVGRARWLATDEQARLARKEVLDLPARLRTAGECLAAAADLVAAADAEASRLTTRLAEAETAALRQALGEGTTGKGRPRGSAGAVRDLEARQRSRATRSRRDSLDRALVDLTAYYRDVLTLQTGAGVDLVHADRGAQLGALASRSTPVASLRRAEAVLACRLAIDANVNPLLAVEAMALALREG